VLALVDADVDLVVVALLLVLFLVPAIVATSTAVVADAAMVTTDVWCSRKKEEK
jgi:hypothetical protein